MLRRLLEELDKQETEELFTFSIVVVDNDHAESGKRIVDEFTTRSSLQVCYCAEPRRNIALARNMAIANGRGNFVAFIDDDEFPKRKWLRNLFTTCHEYDASGVLGPVKPFFPQSPPAWIVKGRFAERPTYPTGYVLHRRQSRTGNVLFKKEIVQGEDVVFRPQFGSGGEDVDFFERMIKKGCVFVWCNEAEVFEEVPWDRCTRKYHIRRALLRGRNSLRREGHQALSIGKSLIALPAYGLLLPFVFMLGHHWFMEYTIRLSDHAGKLLALIGLNPIRER